MNRLGSIVNTFFFFNIKLNKLLFLFKLNNKLLIKSCVYILYIPEYSDYVLTGDFDEVSFRPAEIQKFGE